MTATTTITPISSTTTTATLTTTPTTSTELKLRRKLFKSSLGLEPVHDLTMSLNLSEPLK